MRFIIVVALICSGCYAHFGEPEAALFNYRDDLWCWHQGTDGKWSVQGLAPSCPLGAEYRSIPPR